MDHIVIIGNGIAGVTAARHIRKNSDHRITIISGETDYFFSRTALMYVYMGHMKLEHTQPYENWFWKKNRIELKTAWVEKVFGTEKTIRFTTGEVMSFDKLILATGSVPNKFGWPGQDLDGVQGLYHKQDLEQLEKNAPDNKVCKRAVIVGGGLIGIEMAEMLHSRHIPVTFLVREDSFWNAVLPAGESAMVNEEILANGIDLRLGVELEEIIDDGSGTCKAIKIKGTGEIIACDVVGLTAGVSPNVSFLKDSDIELGRGVLVNRLLETSVKDIYAIGDCAEQREAIGRRRPVEAVWYTGRMMGEAIAQTICGNPMEYKPGHWFNSAKFIDIEYQTYGWVSGAHQPEFEEQFHWRHAKEMICVTIAYHKDTDVFLGINTFGIRMRHEIFDRWLHEGRKVDEVIMFLKDANFDPEFYKLHEDAIVKHYNQQREKQIKPVKKSWKRIFA
ncbi:FAD/NAD(P)-binding oxidoreductase [Nonlabens sp.]|uniref:NAD(P)/FAD-dependent oxidoreductase n=1 Tax=Nonlabens sp. TaxID=1888209 RepID=UPI001BCC3ABE|nr:FAD/NAD(P)-binding oxidoreductase [Nonlabens sp.]